MSASSAISALSFIVASALLAAPPRAWKAHRMDTVLEVSIRFDRDFTRSDVDRVARRLDSEYGNKLKMFMAFMDKAGESSGYATPSECCGPDGIDTLTTPQRHSWPFTRFAQVFHNGENTTVWYRDEHGVATWNVRGKQDASRWGKHFIRSVAVKDHSERRFASVMVWMQTSGVPTETLCRLVAEQLKTSWQVPAVHLNVRQDSWFASPGPLVYFFGPSLTGPTADLLRSAPDWSCSTW